MMAQREPHRPPVCWTVAPGVHQRASAVGGPERTARCRFPAAPASVPAARRFVGALLAGWQDDERVAEVLLCVSELTTNALVHVGGDGFEVRALVWPERVRVEIGDGCSRGVISGGGGTPGAATAGGSPGDVAADRAARRSRRMTSAVEPGRGAGRRLAR